LCDAASPEGAVACHAPAVRPKLAVAPAAGEKLTLLPSTGMVTVCAAGKHVTRACHSQQTAPREPTSLRCSSSLLPLSGSGNQFTLQRGRCCSQSQGLLLRMSAKGRPPTLPLALKLMTLFVTMILAAAAALTPDWTCDTAQ